MGGALPKTHSFSPNHAFAIAGNLLLLCWFGEVTRSSLEQARQAHVHALQSGATRLYVLAFVESDTALPSSEVRSQSAAVDRLGALDVDAHAAVLPGEGFWVSAARSVLGAVFFLSRSQYPRRVFATATAAAVWLSEQGASADAQGVLEYIAKERSARRRAPTASSM